jgi:hypothetical protein
MKRIQLKRLVVVLAVLTLPACGAAVLHPGRQARGGGRNETGHRWVVCHGALC